MSPNAELGERESGSIEWAASPAKSARAGVPRKRIRASRSAGSMPKTPKRASRSGWRGGRTGPRSSPSRSSARSRQAALHNNLADLLHATGRSDEAMAHLKQAVAIFADVGAQAGEVQPEIWKLVEW
jgi:hypothetical protein